MNWLFPIAGYGTRTSKMGAYKPLIEILPGHQILKICLSGLKSLFNEGDHLFFAVSKEQEEKHQVSANIGKILATLNIKNQHNVMILEKTPSGQALTIKEMVTSLPNNLLKDEAIVVNSDQLVFFDLKRIDRTKCAVGLYFNDAPSSCFFDLDIQNNTVKNIKEKEKISYYASSGVFYFTSTKQILKCVNWAITKKFYYNGEIYLGPCMAYFKDLSYFQTLVKFDLGNIYKINLFKNFIGDVK
jgi:hypothetical protein